MNKTEILGYVALFIAVLGTCLYTLKIKGKAALTELIQKAEYIFDWKGSGKEKLKYVLVQGAKKVPKLAKWQVNEKTISRLVDTLQKDFEEVRAYKKSKEYKSLKKN